MFPSSLRRIAPVALSIAGLISMTGCVSKLAYPRVKETLMDVGIPEAPAACMAGRMTDKLSLAQLRRLKALKGPKRNLADVIVMVSQLDDPELIRVTLSAAAKCSNRFGLQAN